MLEVGLRAFPQLIPVPVLLAFNKELRKDVARKMQYQTHDDRIELIRDDGGPPFGIYKPNTKVVYKFRDFGVVNEVTMDQAGFCNPSEPGFLNQVDFVAIGDSFTWCTTVHPHETWTHQLASLIQYSGYNLGLPGVGLYEYLQILKAHGLSKNPKVVVMATYEGNDLRDSLVAYNEYVLPACAAYCQAYRYLKERSPVGRYSYSFNFLANSVRYVKNLIRDRTSDSVQSKEAGILSAANYRYKLAGGPRGPIAFNLENVDTDEILYAQKLKQGEVSVELFSKALVTFAQLAKEHRFTPIFIYVPTAFTAYGRHVQFEDPKLSGLMSWYSDALRSYYARKTRELGIKFIDTTDHLRSVAAAHLTPESLLYYPTNLHLTSEGHRRISELLAKRFNSLKIR